MFRKKSQTIKGEDMWFFVLIFSLCLAFEDVESPMSVDSESIELDKADRLLQSLDIVGSELALNFIIANKLNSLKIGPAKLNSLMLALKNGKFQAVRHILANMDKINFFGLRETDIDGQNVLHHAVMSSHQDLDLVGMLVALEPSLVNQKNRRRSLTPEDLALVHWKDAYNVMLNSRGARRDSDEGPSRVSIPHLGDETKEGGCCSIL